MNGLRVALYCLCYDRVGSDWCCRSAHVQETCTCCALRNGSFVVNHADYRNPISCGHVEVTCVVPWDHVPKVTEIVVILEAISTPSLSSTRSLAYQHAESLHMGQNLKWENGSHTYTYGQSVSHISSQK